VRLYRRVRGPAAGLRNDAIRLVTILRGQIPMPLQDLFGRQQFFAIARPVRGDLSRRCAIKALLPFVILDLLPAEARGFEILFRVTNPPRL
jgi:hypothetical protein